MQLKIQVISKKDNGDNANGASYDAAGEHSIDDASNIWRCTHQDTDANSDTLTVTITNRFSRTSGANTTPGSLLDTALTDSVAGHLWYY